MIWICRSIRQPSPRRLARFVEAQRRAHQAQGLTGLLIAQGRYRLHIVEGLSDDVLAEFQGLNENASGVGLRLIGMREITRPACQHALSCLDITDQADYGVSLAEIFGRASLPDEASRQRVCDFLISRLNSLTFKQAA